MRHTSLPNNLKPAKKLSLMGFHLQLKSQLCVVFLMSKKSLKFKAPHSVRDVFWTIYITGAVLNGELLVPWCFSIKLILAAKPGVKCDHKAGHWDKMRRNRLSDLGNAPLKWTDPSEITRGNAQQQLPPLQGANFFANKHFALDGS